MPDEALALSVEEIAQTCFRVWEAAMTLPATPWDYLGLLEQASWGRVARGASKVLERMEGSSLQSIGEELAKLWAGEGDWERSPRVLIAWEAIARHLWTLSDSEEVEDLAALESQWGPWAQTKRINLIARTNP